MPRVPSVSSQSSRDDQSQGQVRQSSSSSADADLVRESSSPAISQRAGQLGGEVEQESCVDGRSSVGSGQSSSRAGQRAGQAGQGLVEAGQSSNSTSCSSNPAGQSNSGIGRYGNRTERPAPPLHLRESIQGLLNPKQQSLQASCLSLNLIIACWVRNMGEKGVALGVTTAQPVLLR